jgi:outer membrane immunogenic protein
MKKLLLASVGVVAMATAATAADLPARYPTKAPAYVAAMYNWTGFYLGGHVGWASSDFADSDGFAAGGQIGFNYQTGQFVFGVEGDLTWTDLGASTTGTVLGVPLTVSGSNDWYGSIAGRLGVAVGPMGNVLLYVKGGVAWTDWSASATAAGVTVNLGSGTQTGWVLGGGVEYGFAPNWSAKLEYNFFDFDGSTGTILGTPLNFDVQTHMVKVGVNYRFGYR